jgi:short-subunit dehydrogenase
MDAAPVARAGYRALMRGQTTVVPGVVNKFLTQSTRFLPRALQASIARRTAERHQHA